MVIKSDVLTSTRQSPTYDVQASRNNLIKPHSPLLQLYVGLKHLSNIDFHCFDSGTMSNYSQ